MRYVTTLTAALLAFATPDASASPACRGPWVSTYLSPAGCPVVVYAQQSEPMVVELRRGGEVVSANITVTKTATSLDVEYSDIECGIVTEVRVETEPYFARHDIEIADTQPGDEVLVNGVGTAVIEPSSACPTVEPPQPECTGTTAACEETDTDGADGTGCSAHTGPAGLPMLLVAAALLRRRKQRVAA